MNYQYSDFSRRNGSDNRVVVVSMIAAVLLGVALPAAAQNLLSNGDFDSGLGGWTQTGTPAPAWVAFDVHGSTSSGSVQLFNQQAAAGQRVNPMRQCIAAPPIGAYVLRASGYLASGTSGRLVISYGVHDTPDCSGNSYYALGGRFVDLVDQWQGASMSVLVAASPSSIEVSLGIEKDPASGSLTGYFDAVEVLPDTLFANGFEGASFKRPLNE